MLFQRFEDIGLSLISVLYQSFYVNKGNTVFLIVSVKHLEIIFISTIVSYYQYFSINISFIFCLSILEAFRLFPSINQFHLKDFSTFHSLLMTYIFELELKLIIFPMHFTE